MAEIVESEDPSVSVTDREGEEPLKNNHTVEIILRTVGPARPSRLRVPSAIKVSPLSLSMYIIHILSMCG